MKIKSPCFQGRRSALYSHKLYVQVHQRRLTGGKKHTDDSRVQTDGYDLRLFFSLKAKTCIGTHTNQWCAGPSWYWLPRADCGLLFPTPRSVKSAWELEISLGGSIYTTEIGKHYKSGFSLSLFFFLQTARC